MRATKTVGNATTTYIYNGTLLVAAYAPQALPLVLGFVGKLVGA